jgi:hypothetical protein
MDRCREKAPMLNYINWNSLNRVNTPFFFCEKILLLFCLTIFADQMQMYCTGRSLWCLGTWVIYDDCVFELIVMPFSLFGVALDTRINCWRWREVSESV